MFPVTKPRQYVSAASLTSNADTETLDSVATMKVCRVCLALNVKMYHMSEHKLDVMFERITGIEINTEDKLPKMICWECVARLSSANNFFEKALKSQWILVNTINSSEFVTISDIESIDKAQHQLDSKLGFKIYKENYADLYILQESDILDEPFNIENYKYCVKSEPEFCEDNNDKIRQEDKKIIAEFNEIVDKDPIKIEYKVEAEEQTVSDENYDVADISYGKDDTIPVFQLLETSNEENICDKGIELAIYEVNNISVNLDNENPDLGEAREVSEDAKQSQKDRVTLLRRRSEAEALPRKELKVVLEDVMLTSNKHNIQDSLDEFTEQLTNDAVTPNYHHPQIKKELLVNRKASVSPVTIGSNFRLLQDDPKSPQNVFICDSCGKQFHIESTLNIKNCPKMYSCPSCVYKASQSNNVKRQTLNCTLCSYETYNKGDLRRHVNAQHVKNKVFSCSFCSYEASEKGSLLKHVNAKHTKTNVYNCSYCSYKAYDKSNFSRHVNAKHTKKNVYNCSFCSYTSYDKSAFTIHVNAKHTKDISYNCSLCSYKTYRRGALYKHINAQHTKNISYNCSLCNYKAYYHSSLTRHIDSKHNKNIDNC